MEERGKGGDWEDEGRRRHPEHSTGPHCPDILTAFQEESGKMQQTLWESSVHRRKAAEDHIWKE